MSETMSKTQAQILAERLTDRLSKIKNDAELALIAVVEIGNFEISCPKCHGAGEYQMAKLENGWDWLTRMETYNCEICRGTGKLTIEAYEDYQERCRGKK